MSDDIDIGLASVVLELEADLVAFGADLRTGTQSAPTPYGRPRAKCTTKEMSPTTRRM